MSVSILAEIQLKSGRDDEFYEYIKWHQSESREEEGCQYFQANRDPDRSDVFVMFEVYDDHEAIQRHRETPHYRKFASEIVPDMIVMQSENSFINRRLLTPVE